MLSAVGKVAAGQHSEHVLPVEHQRFMASVPWESILQVILSLIPDPWDELSAKE